MVLYFGKVLFIIYQLNNLTRAIAARKPVFSWRGAILESYEPGGESWINDRKAGVSSPGPGQHLAAPPCPLSSVLIHRVVLVVETVTQVRGVFSAGGEFSYCNPTPHFMGGETEARRGGALPKATLLV